MSRQRIAVIDYGMGNLHSVASALQHVSDADVQVTSEHEVIRAADKVLFPGVGAIRDCIAEIRRLGFDSLVREEIASGKAVLAICVGMQALMSHSDENGGVDCLDHFQGDVRRFSDNTQFQQASAQVKLKVPHMGWNRVRQTQSHQMWQSIEHDSHFYFVHSYFVEPENTALQAGVCDYGLNFCAALASDNVFATQFHPEKSHNAGLQLLRNFVAWNGCP